MKFFGESERKISPYLDEIRRARCVVLLANKVAFIQADSSPESVADVDPNSAELNQLIMYVEAVRQEFAATPEDIQLALQRNDTQLIRGARFDPEAE